MGKTRRLERGPPVVLDSCRLDHTLSLELLSAFSLLFVVLLRRAGATAASWKASRLMGGGLDPVRLDGHESPVLKPSGRQRSVNAASASALNHLTRRRPIRSLVLSRPPFLFVLRWGTCGRDKVRVPAGTVNATGSLRGRDGSRCLFLRPRRPAEASAQEGLVFTAPPAA